MIRAPLRLLAAALCAAGLAACSADGGTVPAGGDGTTGPPVTAGPQSHRTGTPAPPPGSLAGRVVVLDPGHNGGNATNPSLIHLQVDAGGFPKACNTTGTSARGVTESSVNLQIAGLLAERLRSRGARVVLTREDDTGAGPCVDERGRLGRLEAADALVSIHADGAAAAQHGFHVIAPGQVPGYTDGIVEPSRRLATTVRDGLAGQGLTTSTYAGTDGLVTRSDLGTLNRAGVPAVMVELGNMHNDDDFGQLTGTTGQSRYADGLATGILDYLG